MRACSPSERKKGRKTSKKTWRTRRLRNRFDGLAHIAVIVVVPFRLTLFVSLCVSVCVCERVYPFSPTNEREEEKEGSWLCVGRRQIYWHLLAAPHPFLLPPSKREKGSRASNIQIFIVIIFNTRPTKALI